MKEVFKSFNFRGALNAEHYQVHGDLLNVISEELASSLDLSDLRDRYGSLYAEENNSFFLSRATSRSMKTVRPLVDKAFKELAGAINALYQANELTEKSVEKERQLGAIIDEMNAILYQLQLTLSRAKAGTKPNPGEESKPTIPPASETPTEPESEPEPEPENPDVV